MVKGREWYIAADLGYSKSTFTDEKGGTSHNHQLPPTRSGSLPMIPLLAGGGHLHQNGMTAIALPCIPVDPPTRVLGMRASDIDKYSRVIFPIMFLTFHLMYWMIYLSISGELPNVLVYLEDE